MRRLFCPLSLMFALSFRIVSGGWYDIFLRGNIFGFDGFQKSSATPGKSRIVSAPTVVDLGSAIRVC